MSREFLDFLTDYEWPGNVRELQNLVERLVILANSDVLGLADLPQFMLKSRETKKRQWAELTKSGASPLRQTNSSPRKSLEEFEREQVEAALVRHGWVQARAARELGLTQRQIGYRMKKYHLSRPEFQ